MNAQIRFDFSPTARTVRGSHADAADNPGMSTRQAPSNPALAAFHPAVAGWFARSFAAPTEAQIAERPELAPERERPMFLLLAAQRPA